MYIEKTPEPEPITEMRSVEFKLGEIGMTMWNSSKSTNELDTYLFINSENETMRRQIPDQGSVTQASNHTFAYNLLLTPARYPLPLSLVRWTTLKHHFKSSSRIKALEMSTLFHLQIQLVSQNLIFYRQILRCSPRHQYAHLERSKEDAIEIPLQSCFRASSNKQCFT